MSLHFDQPIFLLLALFAIPLIVWGWFMMNAFDRVRRTVVLLVRGSVIALVAMLLAGPRFMLEHDHLTVIGLIDVSDSVKRFAQLPATVDELEHPGVLGRLRSWFRQATSTRQPDDRIGLVVFDGRAVAIAAPTRGPYPDQALDISSAEGTNLADAIRLGLGMFPADTSKRLVLISDGNETNGDALAAAREAAGQAVETLSPGSAAIAQGVPIDVLPIAYRVDQDVQVVRVEVPPNARPEEVVNARIVLESLAPTSGAISLYREGVPVDLNGDAPGFARAVQVPAGRSVHVAPVPLGSLAVNRFQAIFEPADPATDALVMNNVAEAFTITPSRGRVLIVQNEESADGDLLASTLETSGLPVEHVLPGAMPRDILQLQGYDLIVLQNVAAWEIDESVHALLARYVRDFGGGLIMTGGEKSFGAGGWNGTAVEEALPLELDLPRELKYAQAALVLVLDKSGSMNAPVAGARATQQEVANEGAARAILSLHSFSMVGVVAFDSSPYTVVPLQMNENAESTAKVVRTIGAAGGTNMIPALERAREMLREVDVPRKHVVVMSDGKSRESEMLPQIAESMHRSGISVSAIAVGNEADWETLGAMAERGGGEFFNVVDPSTLPEVLVDSVRVVNKPLIREVTFQPVVQPTGTSLTSGVSDAPALEGLVLTARKDDPRIAIDLVTPEGDPLLARWQFGLGRAAAFTSDVHLNWSQRWRNWPGYGSFFTQLVRETARSPVSPRFELSTQVRDDELSIALDASEEAGDAFLDHLVVDGTVYAPDGNSQEIRLEQIGPGSYTASVPANASGNYIVALKPRQGDKALTPVIGGTNVPGGVEFRRYRSNLALLRQISDLTGGRVLDPADPVAVDLFDRSGMAPSVSMLPVWRSFLLVLIAVMLLDVASRRIAWDAGTFSRAWARAVARVRDRRAKGERTKSTLASLRTRTEELDQAIDRDSHGVEKLTGTGGRMVRRRPNQRPQTNETAHAGQHPQPTQKQDQREAQINDTLSRLAGRGVSKSSDAKQTGRDVTRSSTPSVPRRRTSGEQSEKQQSKKHEQPQTDDAKKTDRKTSSGTTGDLLAAKRRLREQLRQEPSETEEPEQ